jgi:hypothetical protein
VRRFYPEVTREQLMDLWTREVPPEMERLKPLALQELAGQLKAGEITQAYHDQQVASLPKRLPSQAARNLAAPRWPLALFSQQGAVNSRGQQSIIASLGIAAGKPIRENLGYSEGGNVLMGTRQDGKPYALLGRDSFALTRGVLERSLSRSVSDEEVRQAIAKDYGVEPANVIPVEQPGEFHIDMLLSPVKGGKVIFNSARESFDLQVGWMRQDHQASKPQPPAQATPEAQRAYQESLAGWELAGASLEQRIGGLEKETQRLEKYESRVVADLEAGGLEVLRMAGVFLDPSEPGSQLMNFLNAEKGTGPDGKQFHITLGGEPRAQAYAERKLTQELATGIDRVHFLDPIYTRTTLQMSGGISCRVKSEGSLV